MKWHNTIILLTALSGLSLSSCDVDVVEKGKLPEIDVDVPDVNVGVKKVEVEVPKIETETKEITVPVIGVEPPKDDAKENPATKKEEGL